MCLTRQPAPLLTDPAWRLLTHPPSNRASPRSTIRLFVTICTDLLLGSSMCRYELSATAEGRRRTC